LEAWGVPKTFQSLSVSSPAAEVTVHPFGLRAIYSTLEFKVWRLARSEAWGKRFGGQGRSRECNEQAKG